VIAEGGVSVSHTGVLHCRGSLGVGWQDMGFMGHPVNVQPGDRRGKHDGTCNQRSCVVACIKGSCMSSPYKRRAAHHDSSRRESHRSWARTIEVELVHPLVGAGGWKV
jgi:hypothetical protein